MPAVAWGVGAALLANTLYSVGFVLEKRALTRLPEVSVRRPAQLLRHVVTSPLWLAGSIALASGFGAQLVVYRTLPIAAAQGIFIAGLVLLLLLSSRMLGERTSVRERYAIAGILLALLMVVLSLRDTGHGQDTVGGGAPAPLILTVSLPSLAAGLYLYAAAERRAGHRHRHRQPTSGVEYGVAVGLLYGVSSLAIKGVSGALPHLPALFRTPYPYLLLCTGAFGLVMSQAALQRCRASLIVPVCTTVTCVFTAVLGTVAFGESLPSEPLRLGLRVAGTALAVAVLLLMPKHDPQPVVTPSTPPPRELLPHVPHEPEEPHEP
ncbi:DMT family transporter [Streptomyces sp. SGAir0957]